MGADKKSSPCTAGSAAAIGGKESLWPFFPPETAAISNTFWGKLFKKPTNKKTTKMLVLSLNSPQTSSKYKTTFCFKTYINLVWGKKCTKLKLKKIKSEPVIE